MFHRQRRQVQCLLLLLLGLNNVQSFLVHPYSYSSSSLTRLHNAARDEAEALLAKARAVRQQVADLQGVSLQQVELEAKQQKELQLQTQQAILERRRQLAEESKQQQQANMNDGSFLQVPETFDDQVYQAKQAVERAFRDGVTRQIVRFALLEPEQTLLQQDGQWPGGAQQMYRRAAGPLTKSLLSQLKPMKRNEAKQSTNTHDNAWSRKKPKVESQDIYDFDGSAMVTAAWNDSDGDEQSHSDATSAATTQTTIYAMVQPNTDDKYTRDIESLDKNVVGPDQLLMLVNPFWRNIDSWGINMLAPFAKRNAQRVIFDNNFTETYSLIQKSARGEDCVALKCYPYDWQLYAYADGEYWPFEPYLVHLGSTKEEPTGADFGRLLSERDEFKMSKNMRQMNRMMK